MAVDRSAFGRLVGTFQNERIKKEQLAILDFIVSRDLENELELSAILTLHFGGFDTGDYVSHFFENVRYVLKTNQLVFADSGEPLRLLSTEFSASKGIKADVYAPGLGKVGTLSLGKDGKARPKLPIVPKVFGHYEGTCEGPYTHRAIQLYPYRESSGDAGLGNPFASYKLKGHLLTEFSWSPPTLRTHRIIEAGSYDFFTGEMELDRKPDPPIKCKVTDAIQCGSCTFILPATHAKEFAPRQAVPAFVDDGKRQLLKGGFYRGYVHHEYLDQYQRVELDLRVTPTDKSTLLFATGTMLFGEGGDETIPFLFEETSYPSPLAPVVVLKSARRGTDPVIQLWSPGDGKLRGVWFSRQFGRVGTVELSNSAMPVLSDGAKVFKKISGKYKSKNISDWRVEIDVRKAATFPSPFYPNGFRGWFYKKAPIPPPEYLRFPIIGGAFDFFTGRIAFEVDFSNFGKGAWVGQREDRAQMSLYRIHSQWDIEVRDKPHVLQVE